MAWYEVWSTYKVTGTAYVEARTAAEAVEKALDVTADDVVQFFFSEPHSETRMRARRARGNNSPGRRTPGIVPRAGHSDNY